VSRSAPIPFSRCRIDPLRLIILRSFRFCCHSTIDIRTFRILRARIRMLVANIPIAIVSARILIPWTLSYLVFAPGLQFTHLLARQWIGALATAASCLFAFSASVLDKAVCRRSSHQVRCQL